jgi:hypothetical protein
LIAFPQEVWENNERHRRPASLAPGDLLGLRGLRLLAYVVIFGAMAPGMLAIVRRGRPRTFDPAESPEEYLPR